MSPMLDGSTMNDNQFQRLVEWTPAYDKRPQYGIHGMNLRFVLKGPDAATQFVIYTNWLLKHNQTDADVRLDSDYPHLVCHPLPADVGYHSPRPVYAEQTPISENCEYLGGRCYYDGSGLHAETLYWKFVEEGDAVVWRELEEIYWDIVHRASVLPLTIGPGGKTEESPV